MTTLVAIHRALSNTAWLFFLILGLWGLFRAIRGRSVDSNYLGAAFIGQMIFVALVFLPFVYVSVLRGDDTNRAQWVLAFTTLFLFGIALRSISTSI